MPHPVLIILSEPRFVGEKGVWAYLVLLVWHLAAKALSIATKYQWGGAPQQKHT